MDSSTIAAIATAKGSGGIGIVKISGSRALGIAQQIFRASGKTLKAGACRDEASSFFESHKLYYGHVVDPAQGLIIDEVLLTVMRAPRSYTREDVVEVCAHGGRAVLEMILNLVLASGARLAEPGEFTRRAFLNGRIDLTQAEAVIDLINARSRSARQIAANQVAGHLRGAIEVVRNAMLEIVASVEAGIDFPEDMDEDFGESDLLLERLAQEVVAPLERLRQNHDEARVMREGLTVLIVGRPNVGKSSLLNRLLQKDRAIVTATPGTTRDFIEDSFQLNGTSVNVIDTAGLQETDDPIEQRGIQKTKELIQGADVVFFVVDAGEGIGERERVIFPLFLEKNVILVLNKSDLVNQKGVCVIPNEWHDITQVLVSAKTGQGVEDLKARIEAVCLPAADLGFEDQIVPNLRQAGLLAQALKLARQGALVLEERLPIELGAIDFKGALNALDESLGIGAREDVLEEIFSRFCIGK